MATQGDPEGEGALRLRITHIMSSMAPPLATLRPSYVPTTLPSAVPPGVVPHAFPVVRVFGTVASGQKICANVHLAYPYFFVPFPMDSLDPLRPERVVRLCQRFAVSLNHAICLALRQNPTGPTAANRYGGGTDPKHLHVLSVMLVKGTPFYGYHIGYSYFLKVSLTNPARLRVATEQLRKPVVLGREWQPHEAHLSHVLQFMCDFDLYGCGWLDLSGGTFREPLPEGDHTSSQDSVDETALTAYTIPEHMRYPPNLSPPKETYSVLEIDVLPHQILNRNRLQQRFLHNDLVELLHQPLHPEEKLVPAMKELWEDERRRRMARGLGTSEKAMLPVSGGGRGRSMAELGYKVDGVEVDNRGGDWKISEELWQILEERMTAERRRRGGLTFERFSRDLKAGKNGEQGKYDRWIMTTFEAVSAHWPKAHRPRTRTQVAPSFAPPSSPTIPSSQPPSSSPRVSTPPPENEEDNPFDVLATQASQSERVEVEVDANAVQPGDIGLDEDDTDANADDEDPDRQAHAEAARKRAEEGERFRATQAQDEFDDEDLDELLRQAIPGGDSTPTAQRSRPGTPSMSTSTVKTPGGARTPRRTRMATTAGSSTLPSTERSRRRLAAQAGFGDLSSIIDVPFSSSSNPYDPQTPTKQRAGSQQSTPGSLVRSIFARPRTPVEPQTPTKPRSQARARLPQTPRARVVLPEPRSAVKVDWSPSPHSSQEAKVEVVMEVNVDEDVKPDVAPLPPLREITVTPHAPVELPPNAQRSPPSSVLAKMNGSLDALSPTIIATRAMPTHINTHGNTHANTHVDVVPDSVAPKTQKRVRMSTPANSSTVKRPLATPAVSSPAPKRVRISSPGFSSPFVVAPVHASQGPPASADSARSGVSGDSGAELASDAWTFAVPPPSRAQVAATIGEHGDAVEYPAPFYSNPLDVPGRTKLFAGRAFNVRGNGVSELREFESALDADEAGTIGNVTGSARRTRTWLKTRRLEPVRAKHGWEYGPPPPPRRRVVADCAREDAEMTAKAAAAAASQLARPTQRNKYGFKFSQKKSQREQQNMSVLSIEVFAPSRHQLLPDPEKDEVTALFFCFQHDGGLDDTTRFAGFHAGYVVVASAPVEGGRAKLSGVPVHEVETELELINWLIDAVKEWDPDVLAGWELHNASWGYVAARAREGFGTDLAEDLSRLVSTNGPSRKDAYSAHHTSTFKVAGRHVLNIWRIMRGEVTLHAYTFENVVFHLLHQRIPFYSAPNLTAMWKSKTPEHTARVLRTFFQRVVIYAELIQASELISKNAEFARVFGVDFDAVLFRGSQFKVESFLFRLAKPESFVLVTPSRQQVGQQNAPFAVPLIHEPESKYYPHPVLVLDFQSLYPSVMIAYNICFSTCLGRVEKFKGADKFGFTELRVADGVLELLKDYLTVTPNGMIFVKPAVRKSLLAKMLGEILDTRVMVKQAMKGAHGDKNLMQMLDARQLALKLMANVTYGYTSATYSGRMPCIEIADSIVQTGRETLEKAQELIHSRADWDATVVYGDTDSLFVALPGRSKDEAFAIGHAIADAVTATNPQPVKLKFEKVYMGCVLMAKKRYVGLKYEHPDDEPVFDAKGIETVRRDGFAAQQTMEEVALKLLFRTGDLSAIKDLCRAEWAKILAGRVSLQDFIIAKEVRLGTYSEKGVPPPGAAVAYRRILRDPRDEPQYAERVPYIISNGEGRRLIDRARTPQEMLANRSLGIDAEYYIRNLLIPPLARIFNLVGADVEQWFDSMPRTKRAGRYGCDDPDTGDSDTSTKAKGKGRARPLRLGHARIDAHFRSAHCIVCGADVDTSNSNGTGPAGNGTGAGSGDTTLCTACRAAPDVTAHTLLSRLTLAQQSLRDVQEMCSSCGGAPLAEPVLCASIDCPVTYRRTRAERDVEDVAGVWGLVKGLEW